VLTLCGVTPDPWQAKFLRSTRPQVAVNISRQVGKTFTAAALATRLALVQGDCDILVIGAAERQARACFRYVRQLYNNLGRPVETRTGRDNAGSLELVNGSRVVTLPATEKTVRSFAAISLLILDEAARIPDDLYYSVRPFLLVSRGRLIALSTPFGKRGWFFEEWCGPDDWERYQVDAYQCSRFTAGQLEREKSKGSRYFNQEFLGEFTEATDAYFSAASLDAAFAPNETRSVFAGRPSGAPEVRALPPPTRSVFAGREVHEP
jgi:hypothetical protein